MVSQQENNIIDKNFYRASAMNFKEIPGNLIAYWASKATLSAFKNGVRLGEKVIFRKGMVTADNDTFIRYWHEVALTRIGIGYVDRKAASTSDRKWFPYTKGGEYRKWYGNNYFVVNWENDGFLLQTKRHHTDDRIAATNFNLDFIFKTGATYSSISSSDFSIRYTPRGYLYDQKGAPLFSDSLANLKYSISLLNSNASKELLKILCPTLDFNSGSLANVPSLFQSTYQTEIDTLFEKLTQISKQDWDAYEISWDFTNLPLIDSAHHQITLGLAYKKLHTYWSNITLEMKSLEEDNNCLFINAYGLQDELAPEVSLKEITLACNPHYRYGGNLTDQEREERLQSDTIAELISYTIGCMMGRYSLDREGLVYARAGNEGFKTLVEEGAYTRFPADVDGILPLTTEAWFEDDIAARVVEFVRTVWGVEHLEENLRFIADSLCLAAIKPVKKGGETSRETIRRYLSTQFFKDHLKTYKKRPIYWLFSSGKEKAFECLVYLHRYNETTLPRMRTEYVTPMLGQMDSRIERLRLQQNEAETAEAKRIGKEIDSLTKQLTELRSFDDQLKHYADMKIQLDLDDGVKVNYGKFGTLLAEVKAITGDKAE